MQHGQLREIIIKGKDKGTSHMVTEMGMVMGHMVMATGMEMAMVTDMDTVLELQVLWVHKDQ